MLKWFNRQMRGIQILILLIPIFGFIVEILVRWSKFVNRPTPFYLVLAIITTLGIFTILFVIDIWWCLFFKHLIFAVEE